MGELRVLKLKGERSVELKGDLQKKKLVLCINKQKKSQILISSTFYTVNQKSFLPVFPNFFAEAGRRMKDPHDIGILSMLESEVDSADQVQIEHKNEKYLENTVNFLRSV